MAWRSVVVSSIVVMASVLGGAGRERCDRVETQVSYQHRPYAELWLPLRRGNECAVGIPIGVANARFPAGRRRASRVFHAGRAVSVAFALPPGQTEQRVAGIDAGSVE